MLRMDFLKSFIVILLLSQVRAQNQTFDAFLSTTMTQLCPQQRTCPLEGHTSNVSNTTTKSSCCQQCSCDNNCVILEACCLEQNDKTINASDRNVACHTALFSTSKFEPDYQYLVVDKCPDDYMKRNIIRKCHTSPPQTFDQAQIVSDSQGIIFKNSYCAMCNGALAFNRWLTRIDCRFRLVEYTNDREIGYWMQRGCRVWYEEPKDQVFRALRCYTSGFVSCNSTLQWTTYDPFIEEACNTMQTGRYITQYFVYKNVFCFLCNPLPYMVHNCVGDSLVSKTGFYSFSAVLNIVESSKTSKTSDSTLIHCSGGEVYDYFQCVCRELKCPFLHFPSNGECVPLFADLVGYGLEIATGMKPASQLNLTTLDRHSLMEEITDNVREQVEHKNVHKCQICDFYGISDPLLPDESSIYAFLHIQTTRECQLAEIGKLAESLRSLKLNVTSEGQNHQFIMQVLEKTTADLGFNTYRPELVTSIELTHSCEGPWVLYTNICSHVQINGTEYLSALEKGYIDIEKHTFSFENLSTYTPRELEEVTFDICVDEYTGFDESLAALNCCGEKRCHCFIIPFLCVFVLFFAN